MTASYQIVPLPNIMVAPNGARRGKLDHPELPITIAQTVSTARACFEAGADGLHAHVRAENGSHCLDAALYRELLAELATAVPDMYVQITTEAVGQYTPSEQRAVVKAVEPKAVSISIREMLNEGEASEIKDFYHELADNGIAIQHILYDIDDVQKLNNLCRTDFVPSHTLQLLFVLGRYSTGQRSSPADLTPFLKALQVLEKDNGIKTDWACCAFGNQENACLLHAMEQGGKARVGFENNFYHADGKMARDNAERVAALIQSKTAFSEVSH